MTNRELHVDGHSLSEGVFVTCDETGIVAPFVVFDADAQENIAGPFKSWQDAEAHRKEILNGAIPRFDVDDLTSWLDLLDGALDHKGRL